MEILKVVLELIGGFVLLLFGGNYLVDGGVAIAKKFKLSPLVIGLTIVAFGTSAPELLVSVDAALMGSSGIAIGNVIGSNTVNIGFILGLTAFIYPIAVRKRSIALDGLIMIAVGILIGVLSLTGNILSRTEGIILFAGIIIFTVMSVYYGRLGDEEAGKEEVKEKIMPFTLAVVVVIVSCIGLAYGADLLVNGSTEIAHMLNVSEKVIGLTIVALGTSLPELAASLVAALKKEMDISIGNIIGSNIFNILCVLGVSSILRPIDFNFAYYVDDILVMILFSVLLMLFIMPWKNNLKLWKQTKSLKSFTNYNNGVLGRISGAILLIAYAVYAILLFK